MLGDRGAEAAVDMAAAKPLHLTLLAAPPTLTSSGPNLHPTIPPIKIKVITVSKHL